MPIKKQSTAALDVKADDNPSVNNVAKEDPVTNPDQENSESNNKNKTGPSDVIAFKTAQAKKLSMRSEGLLTYQLGFVAAIGQVFIRLQSNETGGYFSKEWVPFEAIHDCLVTRAVVNEPFSAAALKTSFISKSQNNAGFLAAVLKAEELLQGVVGKPNLLSFDVLIYKTWLDKAVALGIASGDGSESTVAVSIDEGATSNKPAVSETKPSRSKTKLSLKSKAKATSTDEEDAIIDQVAE